jgi:hypothetical protein
VVHIYGGRGQKPALLSGSTPPPAARVSMNHCMLVMMTPPPANPVTCLCLHSKGTDARVAAGHCLYTLRGAAQVAARGGRFLLVVCAV